MKNKLLLGFAVFLGYSPHCFIKSGTIQEIRRVSKPKRIARHICCYLHYCPSDSNFNAIYRNIKQNRIRKRIAKRFGLPINVFESWLTVIAVTRNACGHHSRVWNKQNAIQPAIPNSPAGEWITLPTDSMRAYFDLCIIKYFLNVISPNNDMQSKITWLFIRFPEIDLKALGFPQGWETEPLWR